jgi:hypothetical protein
MGEIVYILINEAMPGYTKICRTSNLEQRLRSLDNTTAPLPFECFHAATVPDATFVERQLFEAFGEHRVRSNREYFRVSPERVAAALRLAQIEDVTPVRDYVETEEDRRALDAARQRRSVFNFEMVNIPVGAVLNFTRDDAVTCTVVDKRRVNFNGQVVSLSLAAQQALANTGINWKAVQGPLFWEYEGETLDERRTRYEEAED